MNMAGRVTWPGPLCSLSHPNLCADCDQRASVVYQGHRQTSASIHLEGASTGQWGFLFSGMGTGEKTSDLGGLGVLNLELMGWSLQIRGCGL